MRRKSEKEMRKEFIIFLIFGIITILCGLFILLFPIIPPTPYEAHIEKEVIISKFDHFHGVRFAASYDYIITEDGKKYHITGDYIRSELSETLTKGTVAIIKYDTNDILPFIKYAEEIYVDGNKIVTYNNDAPIKWIPHIIFGLLACLVGAASLFFYRWNIRRYRTLQSKRDARIAKKYGQLKK